MGYVDRIAKLVDHELTVLESWSLGAEGLGDSHMEKLEKLARIIRQLDLDTLETAPTGSSDASSADLLAQIPKK